MNYEAIIKDDIFSTLTEHHDFNTAEAQKFWTERGEKLLSNIYDCISNELLAEVNSYTKEI